LGSSDRRYRPFLCERKIALAEWREDTAAVHMAIEYGMLPENLSTPQRFQLAKACGFEQIECSTALRESWRTSLCSCFDDRSSCVPGETTHGAKKK
jgi:hypothetical protein